MEFVFIKGECYEMGDTFGDGYEDEKPVHEVCVDDFFLGKYEVTQGQWGKVMGINPSHFKFPNNPVETVSWKEAQQFIETLNRLSGTTYRLPTEAEWEYAARGGGKKKKYSGATQVEVLHEYAWYGSTSQRQTHPVGTKTANELGLHDMCGNVWEWCADWYNADYYTNPRKDNPKGPNYGTHKVVRGGAYDIYVKGRLRVTYRGRDRVENSDNNIGFRLAAPAR